MGRPSLNWDCSRISSRRKTLISGWTRDAKGNPFDGEKRQGSLRHHHFARGPPLKGEASGQEAQGAALGFVIAVDNSYKLTEHVSGMSKVITPHFEKLIDRFVASGRFNNKSEVIRAGLRLLEDHEATTAAASRDDLSRIIQTALMDQRPLVPATQLVRRRQRR